MIYTRIDKDDEGIQGDGEMADNEGIKIVHSLQDLDKSAKGIFDREILEPQLMEGVNLGQNKEQELMESVKKVAEQQNLAIKTQVEQKRQEH